MLNFVAIDFETANRYKNSAISLAAVTVENGEISREMQSLIRPPFIKFDEDFIDIHGIHPEQVKDQPTFAELWPDIYENYLKDRIVIAHNAAFDIGVLRSTLTWYHLPWPELQYACTVKLSRRVWPNLFNHRLNTVGNYLGITFNHHQALDDAETCAKIAIAAARETHSDSLGELLEQTNLSLESFVTADTKEQTSFF